MSPAADIFSGNTAIEADRWGAERAVNQTIRVRLRQVLDHCVLPVSEEVGLSRAASVGLHDGDVVQVVQATVDNVQISGEDNHATLKLWVRLLVQIGDQYREIGLPLTRFLRLHGHTCPGADPRVTILRTGAGILNVEQQGTTLSLSGPVAGGQFGFAMSMLPDINANDWAELAVGAPSTDPGSVPDTGRVYLYDLRSGGLIWQSDGPDPGCSFGFALATCGDVNGDGIPDILVGAPSASPGGTLYAGSAFLISGSDGSVIRRHDGSEQVAQLGWSVAQVGDWDGDGVIDYAVGAPSADPGGQLDAGSVFVYSGATGALIYTFDGAVAGDAFGFSLAQVGDLDGSGAPALAVGAISTTVGTLAEAGTVRVFNRNGIGILTLEGDQAGQGFGWSIADVGDWDGDGTPDLLVGAPGTVVSGIAKAGAAIVVSGATGTVLRRIDGTQEFGWLGTSVTAVEGLFGNGSSAIAYGAPGESVDGLEAAGKVYVQGPTGPFATLEGDQAKQDFGWAITGLDEITTGVSGIAVGAPVSDEPAGEYAGRVLVDTLSQRASFHLWLCLQLNVERSVVVKVTAQDPNVSNCTDVFNCR